jgi:hypothetical protein
LLFGVEWFFVDLRIVHKDAKQIGDEPFVFAIEVKSRHFFLVIRSQSTANPKTDRISRERSL